MYFRVQIGQHAVVIVGGRAGQDVNEADLAGGAQLGHHRGVADQPGVGVRAGQPDHEVSVTVHEDLL